MNLHSKEINDLKAGRNYETVLPVFFNELMNEYNNISLIRLAINYYTYRETLIENNYNQSEYEKDVLHKINKLIQKYACGTFSVLDREEDIKFLDDLRNEMIKRMNSVVDYSVAFQIAEYVVNRVEHRYDGKISNVDDNQVIKSIVEYIFADKDNVVINDKIKLILGQIPVRMTRTKLYSIISDSLTLYKDSDKSSVDNFVDLLSTFSLINDKQENSNYSEYNVRLEELLNANYQELSKEEYVKLKSLLDESINMVNNTSDNFMALMGVINDCYVFILSGVYAMASIADSKSACESILTNVCKCIEEEKRDISSKSDYELFEKIEGVQEQLMFEISQMESILYSIKEEKNDNIDALMLRPVFHCADVCMMLNSSSLFTDISDVESVDKKEDKADDEYIEKVRDEFIKKLSDKLSSSSSYVRRAIMASLLSQLPVHFKNSKEVTTYIENSFSACSDMAEKTAVIEIVDDLLGQE